MKGHESYYRSSFSEYCSAGVLRDHLRRSLAPRKRPTSGWGSRNTYWTGFEMGHAILRIATVARRNLRCAVPYTDPRATALLCRRCTTTTVHTWFRPLMPNIDVVCRGRNHSVVGVLFRSIKNELHLLAATMFKWAHAQYTQHTLSLEYQ